MSEHTPGPWHVHGGLGMIVKSKDGHVIAECRSQLLSSDIELANAKLIASTPDLLDACQSAMLVIGLIPCKTESQRDILQEVFDKLNAAVSKAKGTNRMIHPGIDKVIALLREAGEERFDMAMPCGSVCCIGGHCVNEIEKGVNEYHGQISDALMAVAGIPELDAMQICFPCIESGYASVKMSDAISVLEHYRDTGIVDWSTVSQPLEREAV